MLTIDNNGNITINRGDTFKVPLFIDIGWDMFHSLRFPIKEGDDIFLYIIEPNQPLERCLLKQTYTEEDTNERGDILIKFTNADTEWLHPGTYYYEIRLQRKWCEGYEDALVTLTPRRKFIVI